MEQQLAKVDIGRRGRQKHVYRVHVTVTAKLDYVTYEVPAETETEAVAKVFGYLLSDVVTTEVLG